MKITHKTLLITIVSTLILSCSSDDDQPTPEETQNVLKINNQEFELKTGFYQISQVQEDLYAFGVILYDTEVIVSNGEAMPENNTFNGIAFEINIDNSDKPEPGEYLFTGTENPGVNAITDAFTISGNAETTSGELIEIEVARLQVIESSEEYQFEMTAIDEEDSEIEVRFRGELELITN
ncbi:hypothetical protein LB456_06045 [Psychroflexus sp. CAK57W]|uniref:hypothetical protein n=1 Tax=Psychroflexus curvus TaxID=2873595 RepID=UPI001CCDD0EE|nr:hypothetical protein [Psychroflexus curvus]MBZ9627011.1 hypothetical protein [Psychroflexus curvus]MBZ9787015.1 hypothetical protein [Psychroflexus curvus]